MCGGNLQVGKAFVFIVPCFGQSAHGASVHTLSARAMRIKQAIGVMVIVGARRGGNLYRGDYRPATHRFSNRSNKPVAKAESAQAGRIGGMAFRPGRGKTVQGRNLLLPTGHDNRRDGIDSFIL